VQYTGRVATVLVVHRQCWYGTGSSPTVLLQYWQFTDSVVTVLAVHRHCCYGTGSTPTVLLTWCAVHWPSCYGTGSTPAMLVRYWQYTDSVVTVLEVHRQCCYGTGSTPTVVTVLAVHRQSVLRAECLRTTFKAPWLLYVPRAATLRPLTLTHTVYSFLPS